MWDVVIIGAGPSGALASSLLVQKGYSVCIYEKEYFPRFSIGESLLPHCMQFIEQAGMLDAVKNAGFQFKNGAAFHKEGEDDVTFDFTEKFSEGPGTTFQVTRGTFDKILADEAEKNGVEINYGSTVLSFATNEESAELQILDSEGNTKTVKAKMVLDASGFGRVLPKLLDIESPSDFPVRSAIFSHFDDGITDENFDRNKILITVHPEHSDIWYWLIPLADGISSIGVVGSPEKIKMSESSDLQQTLINLINEDSHLSTLLSNSKMVREARRLEGYSANVSALSGHRFALLGNAGEFLDPVFSSGVTIALRSAAMAVPLAIKTLENENVDWHAEYDVPLRKGINVFKTFVVGWYDGRFQNVIFHKTPDGQSDVKEMISSVLAGYAWDEKNPFVANSERYLNVLAEICTDT